MGRAKGMVLLPPSPLIIPLNAVFSSLPSLIVTQTIPWRREGNTVVVFVALFSYPPLKPSVTLADIFHRPPPPKN